MLKKEIQKFNKLLKDATNGELNAFEETFKIVTKLIEVEAKINQDEMIQRVREVAKFNSTEEFQKFLNQYFEYYNFLITHLDSLAQIKDGDKFASSCANLSFELLKTIEREKLVEVYPYLIQDFYNAVIKEYGIENLDIEEEDNNKKLFQHLSDGLESKEMALMLISSMISILTIEDSTLKDEEYSIAIANVFIFYIMSNEKRKVQYQNNLTNKPDNISQAPAMVNNTNYKVGRNEKCPCGSGKKYKKCCLNKKPPVYIYQLKISIKGAKPPIWRRILVKSDSTFVELHDIIQKIFNWEDYHLYQFDGDKSYTDAYSIQESLYHNPNLKDAIQYNISKELCNEKDKINYTYDFGDDWNHEILLEKILEEDKNIKYPICTAGRRNGPIEDCGGMWGYGEIVYVIENKDFSEAEHLFDDDGNFYYEDFDPAYFDKDEINKRLR